MENVAGHCLFMVTDPSYFSMRRRLGEGSCDPNSSSGSSSVCPLEHPELIGVVGVSCGEGAASSAEMEKHVRPANSDRLRSLESRRRIFFIMTKLPNFDWQSSREKLPFEKP